MLESGEAYHDLASLVRHKAEKNGDRPAAKFAGRSLSYRELDRTSDRVAAGLSATGIGPGDRVAALLFNGPEFLSLWFGTAKAGAILVPLNTGLKGELLRYELADSAPKGVVVDRRLWETFGASKPKEGGAQEWFVDAPGDPSAVGRDVRPFSEIESSISRS